MKKIFFLSTCSTCKNIIKKWNTNDGIKKIDIKKTPLTSLDLMELYAFTNSYEELFNKRAVLFRVKKKTFKKIKEEDYKEMLLTHYSFLKRPVLLINGKIFVGNSKETVDKAALEMKF
jgi:arsenate reductase